MPVGEPLLPWRRRLGAASVAEPWTGGRHRQPKRWSPLSRGRPTRPNCRSSPPGQNCIRLQRRLLPTRDNSTRNFSETPPTPLSVGGLRFPIQM
ncbi:hypothetical protein HPP92_016996 [Vanilla planifolia]|uniref:Uncharacterized protein n=1 Tax=Vanilla planifolia TaxID=51239 RepID=A0A835UT91_VANPL|nr:hypothetical protein HPP92_017576 [Vanilla planifolia]KAG0472450.1 hypothetical protein HPP92_016996 [Vanilla planifolia]